MLMATKLSIVQRYQISRTCGQTKTFWRDSLCCDWLSYWGVYPAVPGEYLARMTWEDVST